MTEEWRQSISFPLYAVSSLGRVRRLTTTTSTKAGRILKACLHYRGYFHHGLGRDGRTLTVRLNRLVCETFYGPCPSLAHEAAHRDGDRLNNRADNLYWATKLENEADKGRHGTRPRGSRYKTSKLTESKALEIKARLRRGVHQKTLAAEYGVSKSLIGAISTGRAWKHVSP